MAIVMQTKSMSDWQLLHLTGFLRTRMRVSGDVDQGVDKAKLAEFCGVSLRTVRVWAAKGLPKRVRVQLENLYNGAYLPPAWQQAGIKILHDGLQLRCGNHVNIDVISYWQFIVFGVDWNHVRDIENTINISRRSGRVPFNLVQSATATVNKLTDTSRAISLRTLNE